jgi:hypothetical protein
VTVAVVATSTVVGTICTQVEVVLAYKGGIFGSLMVYILPALVRTAIAERTVAELTSRAAALAG